MAARECSWAIPRRSVGVEDEPVLIASIFPCEVLLPLGTQYSLLTGKRHASTIGRMCLMRASRSSMRRNEPGTLMRGISKRLAPRMDAYLLLRMQ